MFFGLCFAASLTSIDGLWNGICIWKVWYSVASSFVCKCVAKGSKGFFFGRKERNSVSVKFSKECVTLILTERYGLLFSILL